MTSDTRNQAPPLREWRFWGYWLVVCAGAAAVIIAFLPQLADLPVTAPSFWVIVGLLVLLEARPFFTAGSRDSNGLTTSQMFVFALLLHWGLLAAILGQALGTVLEHAITGKAAWRHAFNVAQYTLCLAAAYGALALFGVAARPDVPHTIQAGTLPGIFAAGVAWFALNTLLVGTVISVKFGTPWWEEMIDEFGVQAVVTGSIIAISPLVVLAGERSPWLIPLLLIPLYAMYKNGEISISQQHQASHDMLTGLPNRKLLVEKCHEALEDAGRDGRPVAVFVLDLDRFKEVNDTLGHQVGDQVLQEVGRRLAAAIRPDDTVARLGGDEFAVLLPRLDRPDIAADVAVRIGAAFAAPLTLDGMTMDVDASIGIALAPQHGTDFDLLMQRADVAMYVAKERGLPYEVYSPEIDRNSTSRLSLLGELRRALDGATDAGRLELHYQPQVDLASGTVVGVEALLRWQHPTRGLVPPDDFIPLVEQTALMRPLTRWVIEESLAQVERWARLGIDLRVAVNVSLRDLHAGDFADFLAARLVRHGVSAAALQLEITERVLTADPGRTAATLQALEDLGLALSLDDFGTGYSSLAQLRRLPVNEIKIDRSFVQRMTADEDDRTIVRSIIELGDALGVRVVAEGVETEEIWHQLTQLGCTEAQGWYFSRPLPEAEITRWLGEHGGRPWPRLRAVPTGV